MGLHINKSVVAATTAIGAIGGAFFDLGDALDHAFGEVGDKFDGIFEGALGEDVKFEAEDVSEYAEKGLKSATKLAENSIAEKLKDNPENLKEITEENVKIVHEELEKLDPFNPDKMDPEVVKALKPEELKMNELARESQDKLFNAYAEEVAKAHDNPPSQLASIGVGAGIGGLSGAAASAVAGNDGRPAAVAPATTSRGVTSAYRSPRASAQIDESTAPSGSWVDKINSDRAAARSSSLQP